MLKTLTRLKKSDIVETILVCPYCMAEQKFGAANGCCGESSAHFEMAHSTIDETYLDSQVLVIDLEIETTNEGTAK